PALARLLPCTPLFRSWPPSPPVLPWPPPAACPRPTPAGRTPPPPWERPCARSPTAPLAAWRSWRRFWRKTDGGGGKKRIKRSTRSEEHTSELQSRFEL